MCIYPMIYRFKINALLETQIFYEEAYKIKLYEITLNSSI